MPKILVVDDEANNRFLMEVILGVFRDQGVELFFAADGHEALQIIVEQDPEIVFLDIMLPGMSGYDVCSEVKNRMKNNHSRIVMLTAGDKQCAREKGMAHGADQVILKPFKKKTIYDVVQKVLNLQI